MAKEEKVYKGATPMYVETNDIEHLTPFLCENLNVGDIIQLVDDNGGESNYVVSYKKASEMRISYSDHETAIEIYYVKGSSGWVYSKTETTDFTEKDDPRLPSLEGNAGKVPFVSEDEKEFEYHDLPSNPLLSGCVVQVSTDGGETYGSGIALEEFIGKCENGEYASNVGAIARITKLINGQTMRIRLIGVNHDVLANTDLGELEPNGTKAKTTWQFLDMPIQKVNLGLPFDAQDFDSVADFVGGEDYYSYPSNKHGYTSAVGLLNAMQEIYNALPFELQKAIKMVRKDCYISRICHSDDYSDVQDCSTSYFIENENDRYGSCISAKLFCLSASELGMTHSTNESDDDQFPYDCKDTEENTVNLEGKKYAFFDETPQNNQSESARNKRICYYNGSAWYYWLRSPVLLGADGWGHCGDGGYVSYDSTLVSFGVAPAFCI
jgi:hypothetical protein